ncbi:zinc ribbon domain-containing protein [Devosia marina]|uniref:ChsH2 rubredoxin-like zinc ribbon domain-containing protein n=1 Tax=Devosia marina TaxID=2683198 RepID=A0A7X3FQT8_9HYPH|nr:zinc ribbon domain-containing protein [Devosia marina]MVS98905.1 hypothetical protein [Devosia marina]
MKRQLTLEYAFEFGALEPYYSAVARGVALASVCEQCGYAAFPARILCPKCASSYVKWKPLLGRAQIVHRTTGAKHEFALVRFDGADTQTVVRLHTIPPHASHGWLIVPRDDLIGLWLGAAASDAGKED